MARRRVLVDVFLLSIVYAYQGLDQLDHALCVTDQVSIGIIGFKPIGKLPKRRARWMISRCARLIAPKP